MKQKIPFVYIGFGLVMLGGLFLGDASGRKGNYAGAPSDLTCTSCHSDIAHTGTGLTLTGAPASFIAGQSYPLTLTLNAPSFVSGGFQIVATNAAAGTNAMFGSFVAGTGSKIASATGAGAGRLTHNATKVMTGSNASWSFNWIAPSTGSGVKFYFTGVASNEDGDETVGDAVYVGSQQVVPVELMSFSGKIDDKTAVLTWRTASERDNRAFIVERSTAANPKQFEKIGSIAGQGNNNGIKTYQFTDEKPVAETVNYYRLRQEDFDKSFTNSAIISLDFGRKSVGHTLKIYPTLLSATSQITVETAHTAAESFVVIDATGRIVHSFQKPRDTEGGVFTLPHLSTGRYWLRSTTRLAAPAASFIVF
jgi:hypothetical protein